MAGIPAFWLFALAMVGLELLLPIHSSPHEPKGRLVSNFGLGIINALLFSALPLSTVIAGQWAQSHNIGVLNLLRLPAAASFAATVLIQSLTAYGLHVLVHRIPLLWRIHSIHHTDTAVDISTGFRHHPLELLFVAAGHGAVAVALGLSVPGLMAYAAAAVGLTIWTHANLRLPARIEQWLRLLFITPAMHHAHHSASQPITDSNYGELFSIWDRCFGTYTPLSEDELRTTRFGLGESHDADAGRIVEQLRLPFGSGTGRASNTQ